MTTAARFEATGPHDRRLALRAEGPLAAFNGAGLLEPADVHVAVRAATLADEPEGPDHEHVLLAVALAVWAVRSGSVCVDLGTVADLDPALPWPDPEPWAAAVAGSAVAAAGVVRVEGSVVYLDRYHALETDVCRDLVDRVRAEPPEVDEERLAATLQRLGHDHLSPEQAEAALRAVRQRTTVLTGGPGTGKTTTIARMLALLVDQAASRGERLSVALAAPTGKAATRLQEAVATELARFPEAARHDAERVGRPAAMTLHRLLGWRPDSSTRFRHHRGNRLVHDVVVVDECSMVELTMMARLLEAVRPSSRLVLVGDPRQLTSVGAGAVLSDVVAGFEGSPASPVAALTRNFRSTEQIKALAEALRVGDADAVMGVLRTPSHEVELVETDEPDHPDSPVRSDAVAWGREVRAAADAGDAAAALRVLDRHRLLCAHREGPYGVRHWNRRIESWLAEAEGLPALGEWYAGRPLLVTSNDYALGVYNGEIGVAVRQPDGRLRAVVSGSERERHLAPSRLEAVDTMHAMTIHKSQGSQAEHVTVLLPDPDSRLLTRELFYTAVTRAQAKVTVVGTEAAVRAAVERRAQRATGLRGRIETAVTAASGS